MKLVVAVRLFPCAPQEAALRDTLALCNRAANMVSARAFEARVTGKQSLQHLVYGDLKDMGLSAQPAIHVARKVAGAYATLKASIRAGNLGEPGLCRGQGCPETIGLSTARSGHWRLGGGLRTARPRHYCSS